MGSLLTNLFSHSPYVVRPDWGCGVFSRVKRLPLALRGVAFALPVLAALLAVIPAASAEEPSPRRWREVWAGADVSSNVWLVYSGVTVAPWSGIHDDGFRFRAAGGYGQYHYEDKRLHAGAVRQDGFDADTSFADVLAGYLVRFGPLTVKGFAGVSFITHDIQPFDDETVAIGPDWGPKGVLELWLNMGEKAWGSLDLAWSGAHDTRSARLRTGYRMMPQISAGLEAAINVDNQGECRMADDTAQGCRRNYEEVKESDPKSLLDYSRAGLFVRYEWAGGEISASAGLLRPEFDPAAVEDLAPYGTVNWIMQF